MVLVILALIGLYMAYKLFIDGWLFKIILFFGGWFGIYVFLRAYVDGANKTALTIAEDMHVSWAVLVPTIICFLCLLCTKTRD